MMTQSATFTLAVMALLASSHTLAQPAHIRQQQQWHHQQQLMWGQIQADNLKRCGDVHGHNCRNQQSVPPQRTQSIPMATWDDEKDRIIGAIYLDTRGEPFIARLHPKRSAFRREGTTWWVKAAEQACRQERGTSCFFLDAVSNRDYGCFAIARTPDYAASLTQTNFTVHQGAMGIRAHSKDTFPSLEKSCQEAKEYALFACQKMAHEHHRNPQACTITVVESPYHYRRD